MKTLSKNTLWRRPSWFALAAFCAAFAVGALVILPRRLGRRAQAISKLEEDAAVLYEIADETGMATDADERPTTQWLREQGFGSIRGVLFRSMRKPNVNFAALRNIEQLREWRAMRLFLEIRATEIGRLRECRSILENVAAVELLLVGEDPVDDTVLDELAKLNVRNLQSFKINYSPSSRITDAGMKCLSRFAELRKLELWGCERVSDAGLAELSSLSHLNELKIVSARFKGTGLCALRHVPLVRLRLSIDPAADESLLDCVSQSQSLEELWITSAPIHGPALGVLSRLKHLRCLVLTNSRIDDPAIRALSQLTQLRILRLDLCPITDACMGDLEHLQGLQELSLNSTGMTPDGVDELRAKMPGVSVDYQIGRTAVVAPPITPGKGR